MNPLTLVVDAIVAEWLLPERDHVKAALAKDAMSPTAIDVCYVKELIPNGFYYGEPIAVKDTAKLNPVPGGIDEPIPRVSAQQIPQPPAVAIAAQVQAESDQPHSADILPWPLERIANG